MATLQGTDWTLTAGYFEASTGFTGLQDGDFLTVNGGATLTGDLTLGALDPTQPVQLVDNSGEFVVDAPLNVVGAAVLQGGTGTGASAPELYVADGVQVESGATLSIKNDVFLGETVDIASGGTLDYSGSTLGSAGTVSFDGPGGVLKLPSFGISTIENFQAGDTITVEHTSWTTLMEIAPSEYELGAQAIDFTGATASGATYTATPDGNGNVVITTTAADIATPISFTDTASGVSGHRPDTAYTGPVAGLSGQYIWSSPDSVAISASVPNVFLKGGTGDDALVASGGNNVLDGGGGSNFLVGGTGTGQDTFFVDGRGGVVTWSTIVNFHEGDQATVFGFQAGTSTMPLTASDGAAGYTGVTIHSELFGAGTGVKASLTLAGISEDTFTNHMTVTTGTLSAGTVNATPYLLIQYDH